MAPRCAKAMERRSKASRRLPSQPIPTLNSCCSTWDNLPASAARVSAQVDHKVALWSQRGRSPYSRADERRALTGAADGRCPHTLARSPLQWLARDSRNIAALDPDRRQSPADFDALAQPRLAGPPLYYSTRTWHLADPSRQRNP